MLMHEETINSNLFNWVHCPVCSVNNFEPILTLSPKDFIGADRSDYNIEPLGIKHDQKFNYVKCKECRFVFSNPRPQTNLANAIYNEVKLKQQSADWKTDSSSDLSYLYQTYHKFRVIPFFLMCLSFHFKKYSKTKNDNTSRLTMVDFGCGNGHTLDLAKTFGIKAIGLDIDQSRLEKCRKNQHVVFDNPNKIEEKFDIVFSNAVIEHVSDLDSYLKSIQSFAKKDSVIYLSGISDQIIPYEKKLKKYKNVHPIEHLSMFNRKNLKQKLAQYGIIPMKRLDIWRALKSGNIRCAGLLVYFVFGGMYFRNGMFDGFFKLK